MKLELEIPAAHTLALECGSPTKDGSRHWRAWLCPDGKFDLRGGQGWSAQEAIDQAIANLSKAQLAAAKTPDPRFTGLQLNLSKLGL